MSKLALYDKPASKIPGLENVIFIGDHSNGKDFHGTATNWVAQQEYKKHGQGIKVEQYAYSNRGGFVQFIDWAIANKIDVINISWNLPCTPGDIYDVALQKALDVGMIVIGTAGNDGPNDKELSWPGRDPRVIAVGAWNPKKNAVASYSSWGANVYVTAIGNYDIPTPSGNDVHEEGTSFSAPCIAMYAAMWRELAGGTREEFAEFVQAYAKDVMQPGRDAATGWGLFSWPTGWEPESKEGDEMAAQQKFIDSVKEGALLSQNKTGIPAAVIIAQACLETGWGKSVCKDIDNGKDSKNLFNIKGNGPAGFVWVWTHEYYNGVKTKVKAKFRAYNSYEESFTDHGQLLLTKRYKPAMAVKNDPIQFAKQLQACGYATDPEYANKLISVMKKYSLLDLKEECELTKEDAQKIADILGVCWVNRDRLGLAATKDEIHRLADEVRKSGGLPIK